MKSRNAGIHLLLGGLRANFMASSFSLRIAYLLLSIMFRVTPRFYNPDMYSSLISWSYLTRSSMNLFILSICGCLPCFFSYLSLLY